LSAGARPSPGRGDDGFILVAVLWILAALATLVSVHAVYVSDSAASAAMRGDALAADSLATAAVELAAHRLAALPPAKRATSGEVGFAAGAARVRAMFREEGARIDINAAPQELLAGLFTTLGARPEAAEVYARRIVDWRSPATAAQAGAEYREAGLAYGPRGAPFIHVDELWLVADLPADLVAAALPHLTVFSGRAEVNRREADAVVGSALDLAAHRASAVTTGFDGRQAVVAPVATGEPVDAVRVSVSVDLGAGRRMAREAVILVREFGDAPYRILSWRDDAEPPAAPARRREARP